MKEQFVRLRRALRYCNRELVFVPFLYDRLVFERDHQIAYCPVNKVGKKNLYLYVLWQELIVKF